MTVGVVLAGCVCAAADSVTLDARAAVDDTCSATFVNNLSTTDAALYWIGAEGNGLRLFYGPINAGGGERTVEAYRGSAFALTRVGELMPLAEYTLPDRPSQRFVLSERDLERTAPPPGASVHQQRERVASACRSFASCEECMNIGQGCGWSPARRSCFLAHGIATTSDASECTELPAAHSRTVDAWLNEATGLILGREGYGPRALRRAFRMLERAVEAASDVASDATSIAASDTADSASAVRATASAAKAERALAELTPKLEAVFDDHDARSLLDSSRHTELAAIHPSMRMVDRRTADEAEAYIARGEPVVIVDAFADADAQTSPVTHKWTLEYLHRRVFGPHAPMAPRTADGAPRADGATRWRFNVAADLAGRCCRYFEPLTHAQQAGYPYPFVPSTHLYRDTFDGFVRTLRAGAGRSVGAGPSAGRRTPRMLHYLHEIVMNQDGEVSVGGGSAPAAFVSDVQALVRSLRRLASRQPFFGRVGSAKLWIGQRGVVMPLHYDSTDNLYAMAWGRKRVTLGAPGQIGALGRFPNGHPLAGSATVNLSAPSGRGPFGGARLAEALLGPGEVLFLPAWWWHQFEQPFEPTASVNLWAREYDGAPPPAARDWRLREIQLHDTLERACVDALGADAGLAMHALAVEHAAEHAAEHAGRTTISGDVASAVGVSQLARANRTLLAAANAWRNDVGALPGGHPWSARSATELVAEYLEATHRDTMRDGTRGGARGGAQGGRAWRPGDEWDLSQTATLPRALRERCQPAPKTSVFMSLCDS